MKPTFTVLLLFLSIFTGEQAVAQQRIEISSDGRDTVVVDQYSQHGNQSFVSDFVPYGLNPDWELLMRMQVGGLAIGDLDGDQNLDLAVGCYRSQSFPPYPDWRNFVLYNLGSELQSTPGWWTIDSASTTEVRIADINNDQRPDIYSGNGDASLRADGIYFGLAGGGLSGLPGWTATNNTWTTGVAICDFDHDGDMDVATSNQGISPDPTRPVCIFRNNNGSLEQNPSWTSIASEISSAIAWGDINNDGFEELAVSKWVNYLSGVYANNGGVVNRSPMWTGNTTQGQKGIALADVNGDSLLDLAISGSIPTQLYLNTGGNFGATPVWQSQNSSHSTQDIAWADVDEDGDPDLATADFSTGLFRIYLNRDGQLDLTPSWQFDSPNVGTALAFGDINGDGHVDLVVGVSGQPCVSVFYNQITSSVRENPVPGEFALRQNFPNPFNPTTTIEYTLHSESDVALRVFDLLGREVKTLAAGRLTAGNYHARWDGRNSAGMKVGSGMYLYRIEAVSNDGQQMFTDVKKMIVLQ